MQSSISVFDEETSRIVADTLAWCIRDVAKDRQEVRRTFDLNKESFNRLTETDKQRLRAEWAAAMKRLEK